MRKRHNVFELDTYAKREPVFDGSVVIVGLDPGIRVCGVAVLVDGYTHTIGVVENDESVLRGGLGWQGMAEAVCDFVRASVCGTMKFHAIEIDTSYKMALAAERMVVRSTRRDVDSDDLIELTGVVGAVAGQLRLAPAMYRPEEWKGQLPKRIQHQRLFDELTEHERLVIEDDLFESYKGATANYVEACKNCRNDETPPGKAHNALDALGIAKRFAKALTWGEFVDKAPAEAYIRKNPPFHKGGFYWDKISGS